jgi:hypothetical protein
MAFRVLALVSALLGGLSVPALSVAHGHVHEHVAAHHDGGSAGHKGDDHHVVGGLEGWATIEDATDAEHAHGHPSLDAIPSGRDVVRLSSLAEAPALGAGSISIRDVLVEVAQVAPDESRALDRPHPERGPPPTLRAPPLS